MVKIYTYFRCIKKAHLALWLASYKMWSLGKSTQFWDQCGVDMVTCATLPLFSLYENKNSGPHYLQKFFLTLTPPCLIKFPSPFTPCLRKQNVIQITYFGIFWQYTGWISITPVKKKNTDRTHEDKLLYEI